MFSAILQNRKLAMLGAIIGISLLVGIIVFIASCQANTSSSPAPRVTALASPVPVARGAFPAAYFSPYVDVASTSKPFAMVSDALQVANGGAHFFTLAFITARAGCQATWGGVTALDAQHPFLLNEIHDVRVAGGDVTVSFGGPVAGQGIELQDLAQACQTVQSLRAQYQKIIDVYQLTHIDFMVEGTLLSDQASIDLRNQALAGLRAGVPGQPLSISYSIPVTPQGLDRAGSAFLQSALQAHVALARVNLLVEPFTSSKMPVSTLLTDAVAKVAAQLLKLQQDSNISLAAGLGITPRIGMSDTSSGQFTLADAQQVLAFTRTHQQEISELSMWSLERDQPCASNGADLAQGMCSGLAQKRYDFTRLFNTFAVDTRSTPTPTPQPTPEPTATPSPGGSPAPSTPPPTLPPTSPPRGGNLLVNPQFNGLTGWTCQPLDVAQDNTLRIIPTATTNGMCTQVVNNLLPNHTYTLQAYVRGSYAYMQAGTQIQSVFSTDYTLLQIQFTTGSQTSVTVAFYAGIAQPEVDIRNASLQ